MSLDYSDRIIRCQNCRKFILKTALDAQCLILESGLILYNCAFWKCPKCETFGSFVSPLLPNEKPTMDNLYPDVSQLERRAAKASGGKLTKDKSRQKPNFGVYRNQNDGFLIRIDGKYLGSFPDEETARNARDAFLSGEKTQEFAAHSEQNQT